LNTGKSIKVLLVDDHEVVRAGYRRLLEATDDIVVVAEAADGESAYTGFFQYAGDGWTGSQYADIGKGQQCENTGFQRA
jgi:hypothetical protein